jgi:hypothetical protein
VRLYKEQFGRGPTKARSHWAGSDTLVVVVLHPEGYDGPSRIERAEP